MTWISLSPPLYPGNKGVVGGGDKITKSVYNCSGKTNIMAGPYVEGLGEANLTLSHIMLQKFISLYPWGGIRSVDRLTQEYHYDIAVYW